MYSHTCSHIPPTQSIPVISPPVMPAAPLPGMRFYEYPRLERRVSQAYARPSVPSAEFAALYLRDDGPAHARGHVHALPTTSRTRRPTVHREHRQRKDDRERERGRTLHRHERRSRVSEASHVATLGGTFTREHTASHSTRHSPAHAPRQHLTPHPTTPAHKHVSSQSHARDHRSHVRDQPPNGHGQYPPVHHHHLAYVPTAPPSIPQMTRSPRHYSNPEDQERRARSQSAPRHRTLRPGRSAMRDRYNSRSRSRSRVRFGQEKKRPQKSIAIPVGGRSKSRKPGVDFGWLRVPR